jgi:CheY-like chemotaxis protein
MNVTNNKSKKYILWVDDNLNQVLGSIHELELAGFTVLTASSAEAALSLARDNSFDIIITDIMMPPPDGIDFLILVHELQPHTPMVLCSAYLYNNVYRERISKLEFEVVMFSKLTPPIDFMRELQNLFETKKQPLVKSGKRSESEKKKIWKRLISSIEAKPGWLGLSIDLKKLIEDYKKDSS